MRRNADAAARELERRAMQGDTSALEEAISS
jgi:hypothetical protein